MWLAGEVRERRAHRRVPLKGGARLTTRAGPIFGRCRNVSAGGLAVQVQNDLAVGDIVEIDFDVVGSRIHATAEVVRHGSDEVAVRFLHLEQVALFSLMTYVGTFREPPRRYPS
jgi:hypothetical protein